MRSGNAPSVIVSSLRKGFTRCLEAGLGRASGSMRVGKCNGAESQMWLINPTSQNEEVQPNPDKFWESPSFAVVHSLASPNECLAMDNQKSSEVWAAFPSAHVDTSKKFVVQSVASTPFPPVNSDRVVAALFNRGDNPQDIVVQWEQLGLPVDKEMKVRDLWTRKDLGIFKGSFSAFVTKHDVSVIELVQAK